jgi:hypothetical protein
MVEEVCAFALDEFTSRDLVSAMMSSLVISNMKSIHVL